MPLRLARRTALRPGSIIKSLLTTMCGGALLLAAAAVLDPATLQANSSLPALSPQASEARSAERAALARELEAILSSAKAVLHVRSADADRGCEITLWLHDEIDPDHINPNELALLRHSPLFQTLTLYTIAPHIAPHITPRAASHSAPSDLTSIAATRSAADPFADTLTLADIAAPGFIDRWRARPSVQATVLGTGLSDISLEGESIRESAALSPPSGRDRLVPRVRLQYARDQADV